MHIYGRLTRTTHHLQSPLEAEGRADIRPETRVCNRYHAPTTAHMRRRYNPCESIMHRAKGEKLTRQGDWVESGEPYKYVYEYLDGK